MAIHIFYILLSLMMINLGAVQSETNYCNIDIKLGEALPNIDRKRGGAKVSSSSSPSTHNRIFVTIQVSPKGRKVTYSFINVFNLPDVDFTSVQIIVYGNCGEIIKKASGTITTPSQVINGTIDLCTYLFLRPSTEHIIIGPFRINRLDNLYELIVYAGKTNTSTVLLNFTRYHGNESFPTLVHTRENEVLVTFRRLRLNPENLRNTFHYQSRGPPDNRGSTFVIPEGTSFYITTLKSKNIPVELLCPEMPMTNFNVSLGNPYSLSVQTPMKITERLEGMTEGFEGFQLLGVSIRADDDIVIFGLPNTGSRSPFLIMPADVAGKQYYILSIDKMNERIFISPSEESAEINIILPECKGNCTAYPECAKRNRNITLLDPCQRFEINCPLFLTGTFIKSTSPFTVIMDYGSQLLQLPPIEAWGRTFILTALNGMSGNDSKLKCISKDVNTNISVTCFDSMALKMSLVKPGDYAEVTIPSLTDCFISSNKPILPLQIINGTFEETVMIVTPIEQYSNDYILPFQLCIAAQSRLLVLTIQSNKTNGLRINGLPLQTDAKIQNIGNTAFSVVYVNITSSPQPYYTIRHVSRNVVFGALQVCSSMRKELHILPLGMRMAPIAEPCLQTTSIPGDGIDNDCDGYIDEDICESNKELNAQTDCATSSAEILPCPFYADKNGYQWPVTSPKDGVLKSCLKPKIAAPLNIVSESKKRVKRQFGLPDIPDITDVVDTVVDVATSDSSIEFFESLLSINPFTEWPVGMVTNYCELKDGINGVWKGPDTTFCIDEAISTVFTKLNLLKNGTLSESLANILNETLAATTRLVDNDELNVGSLESLITSLNLVADVVESRDIGINVEERENFISVVDKALSIGTSLTWDSLNSNSNVSNNAAVIMDVVSRFGQQMLVNKTEKAVVMIMENLVFETRQANIDDVYFPNITGSTDRNVVATTANSNVLFNARLFLSKETIKNNLTGRVDYTATYYRTMATFLPNAYNESVGSDVVSFSLPRNVTAENLVPAVQIWFEHVHTNETNSTCVFWNFTLSNRGGWSTEGCYAEHQNDTFTTCRCNHLTNFAVLMSASSFTEEDTVVLTIITWPGCIISIVCLVFTIALYIYFWRYLKSDKSKILLLLCGVLILSYIILLAGLELTNDKTKCTAIAIVLHYLFLSALCLMVAEGLDIALTILPSFPQRGSRAVPLILFALVTPLVIVGISMGATELDGYGTNRYCWLASINGLVFAFLAPCIVAVLTNITITILVVRRMFSTQAMMKKDLKDKARAASRSVAVLAPILGLTWLFGILAFHRDLVVFSYIFVILNSLQGLFIFIFHCIMNTKMQQAVKKYKDRFVQAHPWAQRTKKAKMEMPGVSETTDTTKDTETTKA